MNNTAQKENTNKIVFNPPRPEMSREILYATALKLAKENPELNSELSPKEIAEAITTALEDCGSTDGYSLAKELDETCFWDITAQSVEILEKYAYLLDDEFINAQEEWVKVNNIQPPFPNGSKVNFTWRLKEYTGVIKEVHKNVPACYVIIDAYLDKEPILGEFFVIKFENCWLPSNN